MKRHFAIALLLAALPAAAATLEPVNEIKENGFPLWTDPANFNEATVLKPPTNEITAEAPPPGGLCDGLGAAAIEACEAAETAEYGWDGSAQIGVAFKEYLVAAFRSRAGEARRQLINHAAVLGAVRMSGAVGGFVIEACAEAGDGSDCDI